MEVSTVASSGQQVSRMATMAIAGTMESRYAKPQAYPIHMQSASRFTEEDSVVQVDSGGVNGGKHVCAHKAGRSKEAPALPLLPALKVK